MRDDDKKAFAEMMAAGCAVYDRKPMEKAALQMYWQLLTRFEIADVQAAMQRHMERSEWFPKPADLIKQITGESGKNAITLWTRIISNLERGNYDLDQFDGKARNALQAIGGMKQLGLTSYDVLDFKRKAFIEAYEAADAALARGVLPDMSDKTFVLPDMRAKYDH